MSREYAWLFVVRDIAHLAWFVSPVFFSFVYGLVIGEKEKSHEFNAALFFMLAVALQILLSAGYVEGWNVK